MFPNRGVFTTLRLSYLFLLLLCLCAVPAGAAVSEADALSALSTTQDGFRAVHAKWRVRGDHHLVDHRRDAK